MSTILFYTPGSCAFGSMIALEWLGLPYRLCRVEKEVRASSDYAKVNPLKLVPVLRHGKTTLTESFAILDHLGACDEHRRLVPKQGTAHFDRLNEILSYLTTTFHPGLA